MPTGVYPRTPEIRERLKQRDMSHLKRFYFKKGQSAPNKGKTFGEVTRRKMSDAKKGKPSPRKGATLSEETRAKISESKQGTPAWNKDKKRPEFSGKNHPRWKEDRTTIKVSNRKSDPYHVTWRNHVYRRDGYCCQIANSDCRGRIEAHHIVRYSDAPELRYAVDNGITLCAFHHPRKRKDEEKQRPLFKSIINQHRVNSNY